MTQCVITSLVTNLYFSCLAPTRRRESLVTEGKKFCLWLVEPGATVSSLSVSVSPVSVTICDTYMVSS